MPAELAPWRPAAGISQWRAGEGWGRVLHVWPAPCLLWLEPRWPPVSTPRYQVHKRKARKPNLKRHISRQIKQPNGLTVYRIADAKVEILRVEFEGGCRMIAAGYEKQGPARGVFTVGQMPDPHPDPGEVRSRMPPPASTQATSRSVKTRLATVCPTLASSRIAMAPAR